MFYFEVEPSTFKFYKANNFGDTIGPYIYKKRKGFLPQLINDEDKDHQLHFVTVGSIFEGVTRNSVVWGTGFMFEDTPIQPPYKIFAVRGELSYEKLIDMGISSPRVLGDPGLLMPRYYKGTKTKKYNISIIPHYVNYEEAIRNYPDSSDVNIINPLSPIENIIDQLTSSNYLLSSSMHGLILSRAYNVPFAWVVMENSLYGDGFKFKDYFSTVDIPQDTEGIKLKSKKYRPNELERMVLDFPQGKITVDLDELERSCPF